MAKYPNWDLYAYTMDLLNKEEWALLLQGNWYDGGDDGVVWIHNTMDTLTNTYYE